MYEVFYSYPLNDGMTITPALFVKETAGTNTDSETGYVVKHHLVSKSKLLHTKKGLLLAGLFCACFYFGIQRTTKIFKID